MKIQIPLLALALISSCSHVLPTAPHGAQNRSIAQVQGIAKKFLSEAVGAMTKADNLAYKSVSEMEQTLLKEIKDNPNKYGLTNEGTKAIKSLDDIHNERVLAEVLYHAPDILKFSSAMKSAASKSVKENAGIAARISVKPLSASEIVLTSSEQTGLGRQSSMQLKKLKSDLISQGSSAKEAEKIYKDLFKAAQDLSAKAGGDPRQLVLARQIIDYSTAISRKTGKEFLGEGGCMKIGGEDVLRNKADIAYKTLTDVEANKLTEYEDIGRALQKNHSEVTNRTLKESCHALKALTVIPPCDKVYSKKLAPVDC